MIWVQIPINMECFLLYMVYYSRETFNINLPATHYDTNHVDRGTQVIGCDVHACWKQNKTINYSDDSSYPITDVLITHSFQLCAPLLVILPFWGVTPWPFKCVAFHWWDTDFSFEFIKLLQNNFSKQRCITLKASIPGKDRIDQNSQVCRTFFAGYSIIPK